MNDRTKIKHFLANGPKAFPKGPNDYCQRSVSPGFQTEFQNISRNSVDILFKLKGLTEIIGNQR